MKQKNINKRTTFRFKRFANRAYATFNSLHRVVTIGVIAKCVLTFAHVSTASAQTADQTMAKGRITEEALDEVIVTGSRVELSLNQTARLVTVITRDEIQRAPIQSIQDLLNYAAGVDVLQRGGHGVQADISIRGGSFDQTAILLNGVNLSNPQTGHYSFDLPINLNDIERIEIIHGPSSFTYGASAFSGGINIITKKNPDNKLYTKLQTGMHGLFGVEAGGALKSENSTNQLSIGYNRSDGYIANSDYDIFNALWQTRLDVENSKIDIQLGYNDKKYGANTFYSAAYPNQYDETSTILASVKGKTGNKSLKFNPLVYWNRHNDEFQLIKDSGSPNSHRTDVYGSNLNLQYTSLIGITSLGAEFRNEGIQSNVLGKPMNNPDGKYTNSDNRTNISYMLEQNLVLDRFSLSAGIMANKNTAGQSNYKFFPSLNASYKLDNGLKFYGSWNKASRMPTFTDLYYNTRTHSGNANLKQEYSESFEVGIKYTNAFLSAYATAYWMNADNLIDWVKYNPDDKWQSVNLASIDKKGIEAGFKIKPQTFIHVLNPQTSLQLSYARLNQDGKNNSGELSSNYVLNYLRDKFTAGLFLPIYRDKISTTWNFRWQKRMGNYIDYETSEKKSFSAFSTLDFRIDYNINKNFSANVNINNLYDTYYLDLGNIPQSGFWLMGGISYTLK